MATASAPLHEPPPPLTRKTGPLPNGLEDVVEWSPKTPEAILALKICDPAMGSGSFLAGALRFQAGTSIKPAGAFAVRPRWPLAELTS